MRRIVFHSNQLSVRGTEVALYDYAHYNETLLGNESIVVYCRNEPNNNPDVVEKFKRRFQVYDYGIFADVENIIKQTCADLLYCSKAGRRDGKISSIVPTMVHAVFPTPPEEFHGSAYAFISAWLSRTFSNNRVPFVPYMVELPRTNDDLRTDLGIPADAVVFGCHGGNDTFDIQFVKECIRTVLTMRSDIFFLFLNTRPFLKHANVVHLPATADTRHKTKFINTCDAMLHARCLGESFGLACAEFSVRNKPVITYSKSVQRNHIEVLGNRALLYHGPTSLKKTLLGFSKTEAAHKDWDCYSSQFSPAAVMQQFKKNLIDPAVRRGTTAHAGVQLKWMDKLACRAYAARLRWIKISRLWSSGAYSRP